MAYTDTEDLNYRGELYLIGAYQTPFLTMIGGLNGGKRSTSFQYPLAQPWNLDTASQDVQTETESATAGTATTITRDQDINTAQIMKKDVAVTFAKQSQYGSISGINTDHTNPVNSELAFQKSGQLRQMSIDVEYSYLQGVYQAAANSTTAGKTRGIITGITTSAIASGGATLSKELVDELVRTMATEGAQWSNPVMYVNAYQKQQITDAFGYAPTDRNIGGLNIKQIETDFATMGVVYDPQMPTDTVLIADLSFCSPVFVPVSFDGEDFVVDTTNGNDVLWVPTGITAAKKGGFFYTQTGIDYGPEEYHGKITGLAIS